MIERFLKWLLGWFKRNWWAGLPVDRKHARRRGFFGPNKQPRLWLSYYGSYRWRMKRSRQVANMLRMRNKNALD